MIKKHTFVPVTIIIKDKNMTFNKKVLYTSKFHYLYKLIKYFCKLTSKQGCWMVIIEDILKIVCEISETKLYFEKNNINLSI